MRRSRFSVLKALSAEFFHLLRVIRVQRLGLAGVLAIFIFALGIFFFFLASHPVLSPFVYPLF